MFVTFSSCYVMIKRRGPGISAGVFDEPHAGRLPGSRWPQQAKVPAQHCVAGVADDPGSNAPTRQRQWPLLAALRLNRFGCMWLLGTSLGPYRG